MEFLTLLGLGLLVTILALPWVALARANAARQELAQLKEEVGRLTHRLSQAMEMLGRLRDRPQESPRPQTPSTPKERSAAAAAAASMPGAFAVDATTPPPAPPPQAAPDLEPLAAARTGAERGPVRTGTPWSSRTPDASSPTSTVQPAMADAGGASSMAAARNTTAQPRPAVPPPPPRQTAIRHAPPEPSAFEVLLAQWLKAGKEWLFGGNLVAKVGLMILFIGVAFLVRLASNYFTVPIELRLAGVAAGAIALLVWAWRIRESRRDIALPVQGTALAVLMLVTFGAFKLFNVLPAGAAFGLLFVLVTFTCLLAVLQDALWLAVFGIAGGFAAPILTSTGSGNHVALFSYYALLNAGILAIALKRSWRLLNVLGFAFTFIVGAAWGEQRYTVENFASAESFLLVFWFFYIAIAVLYAWRRAPELKSYVDGTLVFGVPMAGMALQYGLVKDVRFGMAFSSLCVALTYAGIASALWRWRRGSLRLLVESFLALAIVFGTLAIPLAFDGRWTSAAWAVEGAAIVWIGLKQKQRLAWQFGVAVQLGSWIAFISALAGLDPVGALKGNVGLGFLILGVTGVLLALMFRNHVRLQARVIGSDDDDVEQQARQRFGWLASSFISIAAVWLLLGMWVEVWLRVHGAYRATLLVATALVLVYALQALARRDTWRLPAVLGNAVAGVAGLMFVVLMFSRMDWRNIAVYDQLNLGQLLVNGPLLGGLMLCAGAFLSASAFRNQLATTDDAAANDRTQAASRLWFFAAVFWWCGFVLYDLAHSIAFVTRSRTAGNAIAWYSISFWAAYAVSLALSAWGWTSTAVRWRFPHATITRTTFWPALTIIAGLLYWRQTDEQLWWTHDRWILPAGSVGDAFIALLSGPLPGALVFCALAWHAVMKTLRSVQTESSGQPVTLWLFILGFAWYLWVVDSAALFFARALNREGGAGWQLTYHECALLVASVSGMVFVWLAVQRELVSLRWLAAPAALLQAWASFAMLEDLYLSGRLLTTGSAVALAGCWLAVSWGVREWQTKWPLPVLTLRALHFGRVIAPWLAIAPIVSLGTWDMLVGATPEQAQAFAEAGWTVAGKWPDYLAAWVSILTAFLLLRQARVAGWPLQPLHAWYERTLIPLATLWGVLLAAYWNLRQDGNMAPLPYLPILNPLDVTTALTALLVMKVWRVNDDHLVPLLRAPAIKCALALAFAWLNLMLLRTAAHYLGLPYRFAPLYESQFVQSMLSIVWTLTAFLLMRYAVRRLSKALWTMGAALLAVVVAKLFLIDLSNAGSVARIVSFIGVGALMLMIGYVAPLPRTAQQEPT